MEIKKQYAELWENSSEHFYLKEYYSWMESIIHEYPVILEIGCGSGYSTISLLERGHKVLALDKNPYCVDAACELINNKGLGSEAAFLEIDISQPGAIGEIAEKFMFDAVACWNMGSYYDLQEMRSVYVPRMLEYGLTANQINDNLASSYCEYISWIACKLASIKGVPFHLVDRAEEIITKENDIYYKNLGHEFGYTTINYQSMEGTSLSKGGVQLKKKGLLQTDSVVKIVFNSILYS